MISKQSCMSSLSTLMNNSKTNFPSRGVARGTWPNDFWRISLLTTHNRFRLEHDIFLKDRVSSCKDILGSPSWQPSLSIWGRRRRAVVSWSMKNDREQYTSAKKTNDWRENLCHIPWMKIYVSQFTHALKNHSETRWLGSPEFKVQAEHVHVYHDKDDRNNQHISVSFELLLLPWLACGYLGNHSE